METIAWIPLLPAATEPAPAGADAIAAPPPGGPVADSPPAGRGDASPACGTARRERAAPAARSGELRRGARWPTVVILAVAATVVWGLAWRNERARLESQRRQPERVASRPADEAGPARGAVP
jgi:hypothetical protein